MKRYLALGAALLTMLVLVSNPLAHAEMSPPVVKAKTTQVFTLAVPTEKENAFTTKVELTLPKGFSIDSFVPSPGWKRVSVLSIGMSTPATRPQPERWSWRGGHVPTGEDAAFQFLASTDAAQTYTFDVRQFYSDGSVVSWSGSESSDTPAPTLEAKSSLGGGGGTSIVTWIALVLGAIGALLGLIALAGGKREIV
jgi:uncharacterized protein YcnI